MTDFSGYRGLIPFLFVLVAAIIYRKRWRDAEAKLRSKPKNIGSEELRRKLQEEKRKTERAVNEVERQKEIARIAASISNEQANKLTIFTKIAEEFRTPLTLMFGPLQNALNGVYGEPNIELKRHLAIMLRNAKQAVRLLNQFHDISKVQGAEIELNPTRRNLVKLIKEIALCFEGHAAKREVDFTVSSEANRIDMYIDSEKIEEVLYHLIANAFRFTPNGGTIRVTVTDSDNSADICIQDTGKGIPEENLPHLFDSPAEKSRLNIGLSLVRKLILMHGGEITVDSNIHKGTEFIVSLPKVEMPASATAKAEEQSGSLTIPDISAPDVVRKGYGGETVAPVPQMKKLLVVDNNPEIRELLKECLKGLYGVIEASNGQEALQKLKETQPDLVISDIMMPGMDGFDLCRTLKTDESLNHIPIILLTAKTSELMKLEGLDAGADAYLAKPFSPEDLIEKIQSLSRSL